jgi:hypothetical protein
MFAGCRTLLRAASEARDLGRAVGMAQGSEHEGPVCVERRRAQRAVEASAVARGSAAGTPKASGSELCAAGEYGRGCGGDVVRGLLAWCCGRARVGMVEKVAEWLEEAGAQASDR